MKSAPSLIFLEYKCYLYLVFEVAKKESVGQHVCPVVVLLTILIRYFCTKCIFLHCGINMLLVVRHLWSC